MKALKSMDSTYGDTIGTTRTMEPQTADSIEKREGPKNTIMHEGWKTRMRDKTL